MITRPSVEDLVRNPNTALFEGPGAEEDARAIQEVLSGDRQAFERLTEKYQQRLFNSLAYLSRNRTEAEEVAQEALTQAYLKLDTFRHEGSFYTWLYRIAWNISSTRQRRRGPEISLDRYCETSGGEPAAAEPADPQEQQELVGAVRQALSDLEEPFRTVLILRHLEGCSYETIAEILDLPVGTVRSRIHRGRNQLREKLERRLRSAQL